MDPHIPIRNPSKHEPGKGDASILLGSQPSHGALVEPKSASDGSPPRTQFIVRIRQTAAIAGMALAVGVTAAVAYRIWTSRADQSKPAVSEPVGGELSQAKADGPNDSSPQVVKLSAESIRRYGLRIGTAKAKPGFPDCCTGASGVQQRGDGGDRSAGSGASNRDSRAGRRLCTGWLRLDGNRKHRAGRSAERTPAAANRRHNHQSSHQAAVGDLRAGQKTLR